ncbi:DUF1772 domain-containing protein [Modestobacter sp. I12A-02662]|uniref:anthrone oxygenase family protein n=1 Tax=Modestobacter sp. I12A-02662 TaxID=1730496 RepID=UPI0034DE36BD
MPDWVLLLAALGAGLVAGAFAVFSLMVMPALAALPDRAGAAAMQSINRAAIRPTFLTLLFGTAVLCLALGVLELAGERRPLVLVAALAYVVGVAGVTVAANVPLNEALARADGTDPAPWRRYLRRWTAWNTVRSVAALASAAALAGELVG